MHKLCILEVDNTEYKIPEKVINSYQKLQLENKQQKVEIECFEKSSEIKDYNIVEQQEKIVSLTIERDKYKSIVNKLKKWLQEESKEALELDEICESTTRYHTKFCMATKTLFKIKELEEGSDK